MLSGPQVIVGKEGEQHYYSKDFNWCNVWVGVIGKIFMCKNKRVTKQMNMLAIFNIDIHMRENSWCKFIQLYILLLFTFLLHKTL